MKVTAEEKALFAWIAAFSVFGILMATAVNYIFG